MAFKHEIIGFKDRGDKNYVDENVSEHGNLRSYFKYPHQDFKDK